jgi:hypothetical protein
MKVLFLDHQGVMYLEKFNFSNSKPSPLNFDKEAVRVLNHIIKETDCEIVVSSDWKLWVDLPYMQDFYLNQGIIKAPISYTPKYEIYDIRYLPRQRANEIKGWLKNNQVEKYVAVDDLDMRDLLENFIFVENPSLGIKSPLLVDSILSLFND